MDGKSLSQMLNIRYRTIAENNFLVGIISCPTRYSSSLGILQSPAFSETISRLSSAKKR